MAPDPRLLVLAGPGDSTHIVVNALARRFDVVGVVVEQPQSRAQLLKRRARRLGWTAAIGQAAFMAAAGVLRRRSRRRIEEIAGAYGLDRSPPRSCPVRHVASVNSAEARAAVAELAPDVVVVNGTRILSRQTLDAIRQPLVNMHAGITPAYRGVHGAYWALAHGDPGRCGVTVHLVDPGIDTGGVLGQALIHPTARDNFATYPYLQLAAGLPLLAEAVVNVAAGRVSTLPPDPESHLYYHPTLGQYVRTRVRLGVR